MIGSFFSHLKLKEVVSSSWLIEEDDSRASFTQMEERGFISRMGAVMQSGAADGRVGRAAASRWRRRVGEEELNCLDELA